MFIRGDSHWGIVTGHDLERLTLDNLVLGHFEHSPVTSATQEREYTGVI